MKNKKTLIIGAGITGITLAERFASTGNKVLIIEKRNHIGGNCYDFKNKTGILIHKYGPHIFHTNYREVWDYLSTFTKWIPYQHRVLGFINEKFITLPVNLNTLFQLFSWTQAKKFEKKLLRKFRYGTKISIFELRSSQDKELKALANFIYKKIYLFYSQKQWGLKPELIDPLVMERVPIVISRNDQFFSDKFQGIPREGYTKMFERMLRNKNIKIFLNTEYKKIKDKFKFDIMFYTGPIDEFFNYKFGKLNYRCLKIKFKTLNKESYQPVAVVNYLSKKYPFTRITEFKKLTYQMHEKTTIGIEYPGKGNIKAWPVLDAKNKEIFKKYQKEAEKLKQKNIYFVGRLAEYKYYDMDDAVKNALLVFKNFHNAKS
jgi:UDP-galactopyranose mutase